MNHCPATVDLCDLHGDALQVLDPGLRHFGGMRAFYGPVQTVKCLDDNSRVREQLEQPGEGRVLVVDGGGSRRCALLGDRLAQLALDHGWAGMIIDGMIRDSAVIAQLPVGVMAGGCHPKKSHKQGRGNTGVTVSIGGIILQPGHWVYADSDGAVVSPQALTD